MRVVLPGEPDAPVHLDVHLGVVLVGPECQGGRHSRHERELVGGLAGGAGRLPHHGRGQLRRHQHVGAVVLDGLEGADGPAELDSLLGVGHRMLDTRGGPADRFGGAERAGKGEGPRRRPGDDVARLDDDAVGMGADGAPGRIEVERVRQGQPDCVGRHDHHVVAHPHEDQVGQTSAQDRAGVAPQRRGPTVTPEIGRTQSERGRPRAVGQPGQEARLLLVRAALLDDRRRQHRGQVRPRSHLSAQLLQYDHQLREAGTRAAELLGQVHAEPAQFGHLVPVRGEALLVGLEEGPRRLERLVGREDRPHRGSQLLVLVGDGYRHLTPPLRMDPRG